MKKIQLKLIIITTVTIIASYFIYPSFIHYTQKRKGYHPRVLKLGLDLKGGTHLIFEIDETKLKKEEIEDAVDRVIEIIRNRIDQFGVTEPLITKHGKKWINVQLPGIKDPEMAKALIGKTALLEFKLVDETNSAERILSKIRERNLSIEEGLKDKEILSLVPTGYIILPGREKDSFFVVKSSPEITGAYLVDARVRIGGEFNLPIVELEFNKEGAKIFSRVTEANINRNLSIVLDEVVQSAPVIRAKIPDGRAIIEGNFTMNEAKFLATVLRAGALPAPLNVIEERTVGPILGEDLIKSGLTALLVAFIIIIIFMSLYYKVSGLIASIALIFNIFFLLAALIVFQSTLTLAGIAGIILMIGMGVDANILILERIKEELKIKKTLLIAIDTGYSRATNTIFDANITTLVAALFLFQFGTGPVKGFAITLSLGLIINMFTAIFLTKTIYEIILQKKVEQKYLF